MRRRRCGLARRALKGLRKDKSAEKLLRVLLLHLGCGHSARVRCDLAPVESAHYLSGIQFVKCQLRCVTLCGHEAVLLL